MLKKTVLIKENDCFQLFNCCSCGFVDDGDDDDGCGCGYCFDCQACESCLMYDGEESNPDCVHININN